MSSKRFFFFFWHVLSQKTDILYPKTLLNIYFCGVCNGMTNVGFDYIRYGLKTSHTDNQRAECSVCIDVSCVLNIDIELLLTM